MCCLAVFFTACEDFATEDNPTPSYISINTSNVQLKLGDTFVRKAIVAGSAVVAYSSSDETIATVDQEGKVTGIKAGTATITVEVTGYSAAGKKIYIPEEKSYKVTVYDPVNSLSIPASLTVTIGNTVTITPTIDPAGYPIQWSSSDETIATVDAAGTVIGVAEGTATITAKAGGKTATCAVTVLAAFAANEYNEGSWDGTKVVFTKETATASVTAVTDATANVTWSAGWYTVSGNVTINGKVTLSTNTHLILQDGAKLTINGRISGSSKNLYIYGQANQTGQLVVNSSSTYDAITSITKLEVHSCQVKATSSSDNSGGFFSIGTFNVYGGSVDAEHIGSNNGYGICLAGSGSMNIYGGDVKAVGKGNNNNYSYGITSSSSTVTVYGGKLRAECVTKKALRNNSVTLAKDAGFTGKIETSDDGSSWTEYTTSGTPGTKYVRAGY